MLSIYSSAFQENEDNILSAFILLIISQDEMSSPEGINFIQTERHPI